MHAFSFIAQRGLMPKPAVDRSGKGKAWPTRPSSLDAAGPFVDAILGRQRDALASAVTSC